MHPPRYKTTPGCVKPRLALTTIFDSFQNISETNTMRMIRRTFVATAVAATAALTAGAAFAQGKEVKIGYALAVNSHYGAAITPGPKAWKGTNGAYKFKQFPASALGGERELIEGLRLGTVEPPSFPQGAEQLRARCGRGGHPLPVPRHSSTHVP